MMLRRGRGQHGYILLETTVAIVVLGISAVTIHGSVRDAVRTRGQVQDYTQVRLLMEEFITEKEMQPFVFHEQGEGVFPGNAGRFSYTYSIAPVAVPLPEFPVREGLEPFEYEDSASRLIRVSITSFWIRGQIPFDETMEVLLPEEKLYVPKTKAKG